MLVDEVGGRRRGRALVTALIVLACALVPAPAALAMEFMVDSTADAVDAVPGNESCATAGDECTLRAAIEEANAVEEHDEIAFDDAVFNGQAVGTIVLSSGLPAIEERAFINGRECPTGAALVGPCVGIEGPSGGSALTVKDAEEVGIWGLAVIGAETGVSVEGSTLFTAQASWFGVALDGSAAGNTTGILIGPGSNGALIGGEGAERGNVFANSAGEGLRIHGASNSRVLGNYFGVEKDGVTPASNGKGIEVTSTEELAASGTRIGTKVTFGSSATSPECDGGCNLVSGAVSSGIDLEGDGGLEAPAVATTIAGNYVGLDATGSTSIPNGAAGIDVGQTAQTVIGGPKAGEANLFSGGSAAVTAGPAALDLVVRGNRIGVSGEGTEAVTAPEDGIVIDSEGLSSQAVEAVIADNEILMEGGDGISQQGFGGWIVGNEIFGAETGIRTHGSSGEHGNLIEDNAIEEVEGSGILVENDFNEVLGNEVVGAGSSGIRIHGSLPFGVSGNLIGGDVKVDENFIAASTGAAIEIVNVEASANEVARNWGIGNNGLFIDLVAAGPEPKGPNNGIKPPVLSESGQMGAGGSGAEVGAVVRVFRKQRAEVGELESFLGEAIADAAGEWEVPYDDAIAAGTIVAATQTSEGRTSELALAATIDEGIVIEDGGCEVTSMPPCEGGDRTGGAPGSAGGSDTPSGSAPRRPRGDARPRTKIIKLQRKGSGTVRFRFESNVRGSRFLCKLDRKPFDLCRSPKRYTGLAPGRHTFQVRAVGPTGRVDSSPATKRFVVRD